MERYIRYATYDLSVLYIAMDVHAAMTTRQSITGFLIVNSEYTGHPGSHWVSIVYTITPREKEITQGSSQVTPLSMMTPVTNHERTNATFSELASNSSSSSSSSFANGPVSDLSSNFINYLSLLYNVVRLVLMTKYIFICIFLGSALSSLVLLFRLHLIVRLQALANSDSRLPKRSQTF